MAVTAQRTKPADVQVPGKLRTNLNETVGRIIVYLLLITGAVLFTAPWVWMVSASFQPLGDMFNWPPTWWPEHFTVANYTNFIKASGLGQWFFNSALISLSVTGLQVFFNSLAAYTFAKRKFPGRDIIFTFMLGTLMIPGTVFLIPNYLILQHMPLFGGNDILGMGGHGWLDSLYGLIIPSTVSVWGIFFIRQYMKSIPDELLDAARMDGANEFLIYALIALPLAGPALAATAIATFTCVVERFLLAAVGDQLGQLAHCAARTGAVCRRSTARAGMWSWRARCLLPSRSCWCSSPSSATLSAALPFRE